MGYNPARGLGANAQGPTKIIEESKQKGRRGLGFSFQGFTDETTGWDFDADPVNTHAPVALLELLMCMASLGSR